MAGKEEVDFDPSKVNATWHVLGHIGLKGFQAGLNLPKRKAQHSTARRLERRLHLKLILI